ncbi:MAG: class I adenylate-forming enzyme family protein [Acidimicrobiales bacterium]
MSPESRAAGASHLRPTYEQTNAEQWQRPGGPWDVGPLGALSPSGDHLAVVDGSSRFEGRQFDALVDDLAARMRASGVGRGHVVAWQLPNSAASLLLYWACWRIGAVAAPLHRRLGAAEVSAALDQVLPAVVVATAGLPAADLPETLVLALAASPSDLAALFGIPGRGGPGHEDQGPGPAWSPAQGSDIAAVLFTSGSSGVPKAVLHTHRGLAYKARLMARVHGLSPGDPVLAPAPLAHVSGLLNGVLISAVLGGPCVLIDPWDPEEGLRLLAQERVAFVGAPPIFFSQMAGLPSFSRERVSALRLISTGGASVSPAFVESTAEAFGCRVKRTYGSTEAPTVTTSGPDDPHERARDTDGHVVGDAQVEIHEPESGRRLGPGHIGELWIRGPELFAGYASSELTGEVIAQPGGWYRSGDLGSLDDEGWLRVTGRLSDIIIRAGENISASEVEAVLEAHPSVRNAVAVPVADPRVGERVAAIVVTTGTFDLEECRTWFAERGVTRFKTPELVIGIDSIPTLAAGKPDRAALKKLAERVARGEPQSYEPQSYEPQSYEPQS